MKKNFATAVFWITVIIMTPFYILNEWAAENMD
jgi:hypothetical protein